jgi:hypothetical protein
MRSFFYLGFGVALLFFFPLSLAENAAYSVFALFRGERQNSTKALLFGTFIISVISTSIAIAFIAEVPFKFPGLLPLATTIVWAWYFALVPQLIIRKVLPKGDSKTLPDRHLKMILLRIVLTVVLPVGLYLVHGLLGLVFGIASD